MSSILRRGLQARRRTATGEDVRIRRTRQVAVVAAAALVVVGVIVPLIPAHSVEPSAPRASGWTIVKFPQPQPACTGVGILHSFYFDRLDCGFGYVSVSETNPPPGSSENPESDVEVDFIGPDGTLFHTEETSYRQREDAWQFFIRPRSGWPAGTITLRAVVVEDKQRTPAAGTGRFFLNTLGADVAIAPKEGGEEYAPGDEVPVTGNVHELDDRGLETEKTGVPAQFQLRVVGPRGEVRGPYPPITADDDGDFAFTLPPEATAGFEGTIKTGFKTTVSVEVVNASYDDPVTGPWAAKRAGAASLRLFTQPDVLLIENEYISSLGWVKPGETYPFRVFVQNFTKKNATNLRVTIPAPPGAIFRRATPLGRGVASVSGGGSLITWRIARLGRARGGNPRVATLIGEARAARYVEDPEIAWKDLSSTARLRYDGYSGVLRSESHGPKVIPKTGAFETARYGDKPFPIVPVDYTDRSHQEDNTGDQLSTVVNDPEYEGSTFNLYQEMSYGQLFPEGTVPSADIATAGFDYEPGFDFTEPTLTRDCRGATFGSVGESSYGSPAYPERIRNGWYQLPGNTEYYGGDYPAFTLGIGSSIDSACGPLGKAVFDAAQIADPEIDYNDYDFDKDGMVDFFMLVFVGCGGNGPSQIPTACPYDDEPYDNIWPHSSSLESQFKDEETGLRGYISDDQLKSLEEVPQCWTSEARTEYDDCAAAGGSGLDNLPVLVRVGPYNVNPETAIESASVISHEFGHHLGLPDFYSRSYEAYADWNLMAADYSQHMTVFSKQDLGWVVPHFVQPGQRIAVDNWREIKGDTGVIRWETPYGKPYTLSAANGDQNVHNGQAYSFKLPQRQIIDPKKVAEEASPTHVWWSRRGNDFGCSPTGAHNLDVYLPELAQVEAGTPVTLTFKSSWDIEWDWDYGFVLVTTDGENYTSQDSDADFPSPHDEDGHGYTTDKTFNPNGQQCLEETDNGLTGQSGAYAQNPATVEAARVEGDYSHGSPFLEDRYDLSDYAGQQGVTLRFSYFTDAAFDRPGWFIDDLEITAGDEVLYSSDFESGDEPGRLFPGGCDPDGFNVAAICTAGWQLVNAAEGSPADHAYYLELRDQSGFDFDGHGQSDRGDTSWEPGLLIEYTDEAHGYGNSGTPLPPAQHYLDSQPRPGDDCVRETGGNCANAAFTDFKEEDDGDPKTEEVDDTHFDDRVAPGHNNPDENQKEGWIDNFEDPGNEYNDDYWHFDYNCLTLDVQSMEGEAVGPEPLPSDLTADVLLRAGDGCRVFDYFGPEGNDTPTARAQARPTRTRVGGEVTFDGSRSFDDLTPTDDLTYRWDFDGDGTYDRKGQTQSHTYRRPGTYEAGLRVRDDSGLSGVDTVTITVRPKKKTGGGGGGGGDDGDEVGGERQADRPPTRPAGEAAGEAEGAGLAVTGLAIWALLISSVTLLAGGRLLARRRHDLWTRPPDGGS